MRDGNVHKKFRRLRSFQCLNCRLIRKNIPVGPNSCYFYLFSIYRCNIKFIDLVHQLNIPKATRCTKYTKSMFIENYRLWSSRKSQMNVQLVAQTWWSNINSGHICRSECSCLLRYNFPAIEFRMVYFGPCVFDYLCKLNLTCKQGSCGALNMTCLLAVSSRNPIFYARFRIRFC